jgi:hypothetical protein
MNRDESCDAGSQQKRRRHKCRPQTASGVKPAVAVEGGHDIPPEAGRFPSSQAVAYFLHHGDFEETAAASTNQASCRKNLRKQE